MTKTKAPNARIVLHIRGKPATWLTPLPPNRGPTEADQRITADLQTEENRFTLKRGTNLAVRQKNIEGRGREPTEVTIDPNRSVFLVSRHYRGGDGYRTGPRIRGPNLIRIVQTHVHGREGPGCRREKQIGDI